MREEKGEKSLYKTKIRGRKEESGEAREGWKGVRCLGDARHARGGGGGGGGEDEAEAESERKEREKREI